MADHSTTLDDVFSALADPTRRDVVRQLGRGDASVSELAAGAPMSLPSFLKHVRALERSGIVRTSKVGRVRMCSLRREQLVIIDDWIAGQRRVWEEHTGRLEKFVTHLEK